MNISYEGAEHNEVISYEGRVICLYSVSHWSLCNLQKYLIIKNICIPLWDFQTESHSGLVHCGAE